MIDRMEHLIELIIQIEERVHPTASWRASLQTNLAAGLGAISAWSQHLDIQCSGELQEKHPLGKELVASQIDAIAANGAEVILSALADREEGMASRLIMEGLHQPKGVYHGPTDERQFGRSEERPTNLLDPIDGTTNLRDGRFFDAATVVATSRSMSSNQQPTFRDVEVASIWFLSLTHKFHVRIEGILANPHGLLTIHLRPDLASLSSIVEFRPEIRKMHEVVFASYYLADPLLTKIESSLVKKAYPIVPGCGSSALDCLRILHQTSGAYIDIRNQIPQARARLHTYDIAAIPFLVSKWSESFESNLQIFAASSASSKITRDQINQLPLYPAPLSFVLTKNIDADELLQYLRI